MKVLTARLAHENPMLSCLVEDETVEVELKGTDVGQILIVSLNGSTLLRLAGVQNDVTLKRVP